jgi:hypothetical protein
MNKKAIYMAPAIEVEQFVEEISLMDNSIAEVGGDSGIGLGEGEAPSEGDVREFFNVFE